MNDDTAGLSDEEIQVGRDGISRRTIVRGAAWSIPVVAAAVALPSASASGLLKIVIDIPGGGGCVAPGAMLPNATATVSDESGPVTDATVTFTFASTDGGVIEIAGNRYPTPNSTLVLPQGVYSLTGVTAVTSGTVVVSATARTTDGRTATSNVANYAVCALDGNIWGWGRNLSGEHAQGTTVSPTTTMLPWKITPTTLFSGAIEVAGSWGSFTALKSDGTVWSTGSGAEGELGDGRGGQSSPATDVGFPSTSLPTPAVFYGSGAPVTGMIHLADQGGGIDRTMFAQSADGSWWATGEHHGPEGYDLFALGTNDNGNAIGNYNSFVQVGQALPGGAGAVKSATTAHWFRSVFLMNDGTVYSAGQNRWGAAGLGPDPGNFGVSVAMNATAGYRQARTADGNVFTASQMVAHERNAFFIGTDGKLYGTGENSYGQLAGAVPMGVASADGNTNTVSPSYATWVTPLPDLPGGAAPVKIWAGPLRVYVKGSDGNLYAAGHNTGGQLGVGDRVDKNAWTRVLVDEEVVDVQAVRNGAAGFGGDYPRTMFLTASGKIFYAGSTVEGGLSNGNGADTYMSTPTPVILPAGKKAIDIAASMEISQGAVLVNV